MKRFLSLSLACAFLCSAVAGCNSWCGRWGPGGMYGAPMTSAPVYASPAGSYTVPSYPASSYATPSYPAPSYAAPSVTVPSPTPVAPPSSGTVGGSGTR